MQNLSAKTGISREFGHWVLGGFSIGLPKEKLNASRYLLLANGLANDSFGCLLDRRGSVHVVNHSRCHAYWEPASRFYLLAALQRQLSIQLLEKRAA